MPNRCRKIVLGPIVRIIARSDSSKPRIIAVMPTIDVMPMTTPSTVSAERILLPRTVSNAIATTSLIREERMAISVPSHKFQVTSQRVGSRKSQVASRRSQVASRRSQVSARLGTCDLELGTSSLSPQRLDRIQPRRAHGGVEPEEQPDRRGDADAEH